MFLRVTMYGHRLIWDNDKYTGHVVWVIPRTNSSIHQTILPTRKDKCRPRKMGPLTWHKLWYLIVWYTINYHLARPGHHHVDWSHFRIRSMIYAHHMMSRRSYIPLNAWYPWNQTTVGLYLDRFRTMSLEYESINPLRPRKKTAISQTTFSNEFSWMKIYKFRLTFHWSLFPWIQLTIFHDSDNGLVPARRQAIIWTNDDLFTDAHMRRSASMS